MDCIQLAQDRLVVSFCKHGTELLVQQRVGSSYTGWATVSFPRTLLHGVCHARIVCMQFLITITQHSMRCHIEISDLQKRRRTKSAAIVYGPFQNAVFCTASVQQETAHLNFLLNLNTRERVKLLFWQLTAACVWWLFFHRYQSSLIAVFLCVTVWSTVPLHDVCVTLNIEKSVTSSSDSSKVHLRSTMLQVICNWKKLAYKFRFNVSLHRLLHYDCISNMSSLDYVKQATKQQTN